MKICVDCRWCVKPGEYVERLPGGGGKIAMRTEHECVRPIINVITGESTPNAQPCRKERRYEGGDACCIFGQYFEAIPTSSPNPPQTSGNNS